jgi:hypothetical protein
MPLGPTTGIKKINTIYIYALYKRNYIGIIGKMRANLKVGVFMVITWNDISP